MWNWYKYIFYWLYSWQKDLWGDIDAPEYSAAFGMSLSFVCLVLTISMFIDLIIGLQTIPSFISKGTSIIFLTCIFLVHYFTFIHADKYKSLEKEYEVESNKERKRKGIFVILYVFGIFLVFGTILIFG